MVRYIVYKLLWLIPVVLVISVATFSLTKIIPGDIAEMILSETADAQSIAELRSQLGVDLPIHVHFAKWLGQALKGDFGRSLRSPVRVMDRIRSAFPVSLELVGLSMLLSLAVGIPIGAVIGRKPGSVIDAAGTTFAGAAIGLPGFLVGVILILILGVKLRWLPVSGYMPPTENLAQHLKLMIMPTLVTATSFLPVVVQMTRSQVLEVYREQYITTARSKGLSEGQVFLRHALKIVLLPILTLTGVRVGMLFSAGVITEVLFAMPGTGRLMAESIFSHDLPMVQGAALVVTVTVVLSSLIVDILYVYLDPRIKYG